MSDETTTTTSEEIEPTMDGLLAKQVYLNAKAIANMLKDFGGDITQLTTWISNLNTWVTEINNAVYGGDPDDPTGIVPEVTGSGDVRGKLPELNVIGAHALDTGSTENLGPAEYNRLVTYEVKTTAAIGLDTMTGVTASSCIVVTWAGVAQSLSDVNSFQIAYLNDGITYSRIATTGNEAWGEWTTGTIGGGETEHTQESETQPTDQEEGDYWLEPITGSPAE